MQEGSRSPERTQHIGGREPTGPAEPRALRDEEKAAWAALLGQALPPVHAAAPETSKSDGGVSSRAAISTPGSGESQAIDTGGVNPNDLPRLTLSVTSETLGQIDFVVDRSGGELSLWIAASDEARALILADQTGLARHLEGARVPVKNLSVVGHGELGIVLARGRVKREAESSADSTRTPDRPRKRRLDLIG